MSDSCYKCGAQFSATDTILKCIECKQTYHTTCTRGGVSLKHRASKAWKCDNCRVDAASQQNSEDSEENKPIHEALHAMKTEILSSIDSLKCEVKAVNLKFDIIKDEQLAIQSRCNELEKSNAKLCEEVCEMRLKLHDAEQHSRSANIEIQGVPITEGENMMELLKSIARPLNIPFKKEDVSIVHRLRLFSEKLQHPPIIVQFVSRAVKEAWVTAAWKKKSLNTSEIAPSLRPSGAVYINNHLTANNKMLLGRARRMKRERKLFFAAFVNGKVLVKKKEGDNAVRVFTMQELDSFAH